MTQLEFENIDFTIITKAQMAANPNENTFWIKLRLFLIEVGPLIIDHTPMSFIKRQLLKLLLKLIF